MNLLETQQIRQRNALKKMTIKQKIILLNIVEIYFIILETKINLYFKYQYDSSELPSSLITTFRVAFDSYSTSIANYKILCANVPINTQDSELINILNNTKDGESACINGFKRDSFYDGFVRLDKEKNVLDINSKDSHFIDSIGVSDIDKNIEQIFNSCTNFYNSGNSIYNYQNNSPNINNDNNKNSPSNNIFPNLNNN